MESNLLKTYYFISGLPRSGSTLLSAILQQNPRFHTGISDHLLAHVRNQIEVGNNDTNFDQDQTRLKEILQATINAYYYNINLPVIFNTNRMWTNLLPEINDLFPKTRVICCVRDLNQIINSFELLHQKNPYNISTIFNKDVDLNVYSRARSLMNNGLVSAAYESLKSAYYGMFRHMLFLVEYELLVKNPAGTLKAIYNFIDQPHYEHDFNNVQVSYEQYDQRVGMKDLHTTKKIVKYYDSSMILPPDIVNEYSNLEFWRQ